MTGILRAIIALLHTQSETVNLGIEPTLACEAQTHFRSSLLSLRKIASVNPSGKTISVTQELLFSCWPIRMHDRYSSCFSRTNLRDVCPGFWCDSQLWHVKSSNMQRETSKKICHDAESCFLCKGTFSVAKEKIRVFGKSSLDISSLIHRALNVYLTVYVDREQLAICRTQCYSWIVRYKNAVQKVEEIGGEIKRNFGGDFPFRVKRMVKDHFNSSERGRNRRKSQRGKRRRTTTTTGGNSMRQGKLRVWGYLSWTNT